MRLEGSKLVVVGGAGLIGSHTVDALLKEGVAEIVVFDNFARGSAENLEQALNDPRLVIAEGDIGDSSTLRTAFSGADGVFHFAALWLRHCYEHPREGFDVNVAGMFNVLEACRDAEVGRLVFSSSASVYGDAVEKPMSETHPFNNTTFYGASKIAGEVMVKAFHHRYGLGYVGLRYFNVYGPRQDYEGAYVAVIMKMLDRLDQGMRPIVHGDGTQAFDFIHVEDCARANVMAMKSESQDRFYNVCTGNQTSIKELAEILIGLCGKDVAIDYQTEETAFVTDRIGDPILARQDLGFCFEIGLLEGLGGLIKWRDEHRRRGSRTS